MRKTSIAKLTGNFIIIFSICSSNNSSDNHTESPLQVLNYPGSVQEKERTLNEMIFQLQMVKQHLLNQPERVSCNFFLYRISTEKGGKTKSVTRKRVQMKKKIRIVFGLIDGLRHKPNLQTHVLRFFLALGEFLECVRLT